MKRTFTFALLTGLMLVLAVSTTALAQDSATPTPTCPNGGWVDADGDGVCDNAPQDGTGQQRGRQNGQGMGPGSGPGMGQGQGMGPANGQGMGQGPNFEDADGDGVCDHQGQGGQQQGRQGMGRHGGMRGHQGHGQGMGQGPQR